MDNGEPTPIPPEVMADLQAVADAIATARPRDPEVALRARERSLAVQKELQQACGVREIAVELVRQGRKE